MDLVEATLLIKKLLKRPVAYHRSFCEMTGKACAGVMLSQAWYWSTRTDDDDGWFYKTGKEWREETGLSRTEQETARKRLINLGLMEEKERGMPCKMHFRVNIENVVGQLVENPHTVSRQKIRKLVGQKSANLRVENPHTVLITESTAESTQRLRAGGQSKPVRQKSPEEIAEQDPNAEGRRELLNFLQERIGPLPDAGAQAGAVNWLFDRAYSSDQLQRCWIWLDSQSWRTEVVTWRTVKKQIGGWVRKGEPLTSQNGNGANGKRSQPTRQDTPGAIAAHSERSILRKGINE